MPQLSRFAKRKNQKEKPTLKQRLVGRTLAGKIVRGIGATAVVGTGIGAGVGARKARSYLGNVAGVAKEKGSAAYKTYAANTGSTENAAKYAQKAQRGAYVGKIRRDLGRVIGQKRAAGVGEWLYGRSRRRGAMAYSRRDNLSTFTMADAVDAFYQGSVAQFKKTEKKPKKKGNAITKGLKYGALAGAGLGAIGGVSAINSALKTGVLPAGPPPNAYRAIGGSVGGVRGAAQLGSLGALGGLGVYGVNRLRNRGKKKEPRGLRGRVSRLRRRFA